MDGTNVSYVCERCGYTCNRRNVLKNHIFHKKHICFAKCNNVSQCMLQYMYMVDYEHKFELFPALCRHNECNQITPEKSNKVCSGDYKSMILYMILNQIVLYCTHSTALQHISTMLNKIRSESKHCVLEKISPMQIRKAI